MLSELARAYPIVRETFQEASDTLDIDFWSMVTEGPNDVLNRTENTQPAMLAAGVAIWRVWRANDGCEPQTMAGHSFGEYTALVCAGALEFRAALPLVQQRGRLMQSAVPEGRGAMVAILGLEDQRVVEICAEAEEKDQVVSAANFNSPGQVVIAGHAEAVNRAASLASQAGARRALRLAVSVPAHCSLMESAARRLSEHLGKVSFAAPACPVIHNADVASYADPGQIRDALMRQMHSPVRWAETIQAMGGQGVSTILELGPGGILTGLNRRIDRSIDSVCVHGPDSLEQALGKCVGGEE